MPDPSSSQAGQASRTLGLYDVVCIIVGIIIGSAIYQTPRSIAGMLSSEWAILSVWFLGGFLSFLGALCYAELASAYPKEGGDYFFLTHAYGSWAGFLYAWGRLWVIHTGNIALMAYIAANYATELLPFPNSQKIYALLAVLIFTFINCLGVRGGKWTQNLLTTTKVLGLFGVVAVGVLMKSPSPQPAPVGNITLGAFFMALIFVQFTYGGWSDGAFVASEVKKPQKNILRSLMVGIVLVTVVYLSINLVILRVLGTGGAAGAKAVVAEMVARVVGPVGAKLVSLLVVISALGSVNGMIFTGARIFHAFGTDHTLFRFMGGRHRQMGSPLTALLGQGIISGILVIYGGFESLIIYTTAAHWLFLMMVGVALFVFRRREPQIERPYRVHLYPLTPILYIASCGMFLYSSLMYANSVAPYGALIGFLIVLSGLPFYWLSRRMG